MYYETNDFEQLIQHLASLEKLGFPYVVQRDEKEVGYKTLGFIRKTKMEPVWKIQVVQYVEESVDNGENEEDLQGRHDSSGEITSEQETGNGLG
jgi:hypothetical protein